jgi:hypothetical protein
MAFLVVLLWGAFCLCEVASFVPSSFISCQNDFRAKATTTSSTSTSTSTSTSSSSSITTRPIARPNTYEIEFRRDDDDDNDNGDDDVMVFDHRGDTNSRRTWLRNTIAMTVVAGFSGLPRPSSASAADELPSFLRGYTKLAPLGPSKQENNKSSSSSSSSSNNNNKKTGLSPEEMARRLAIDLVEGAHGRGGYFLTGDLSMDLFRDDCVFEDPTNSVNSLSQYQKALTLLFDPDRSTVELLGNNGLSVLQLDVEDEEGSKTTIITGRLRSRGYLKVAPWKPYVKAYETTIRYTLDPVTGLIARQDQEWTKDASEALKETFTPSWNGAPPKSLRTKSEHAGSSSEPEPEIVTALFGVVNGRRPNEYSSEERKEIDARIERIVALASEATAKNKNAPPGLAGTWVLVYLQQGPDGAGIDRRIPFFPDFDFNDSFQVFSSNDDAATDKVTNIGQVLGSLADVRVSGSLRELASTTTNGSTTNASSNSTTKRRFEANIEGGRLCFGTSVPNTGQAKVTETDSSNYCPFDLPMIKGKGIFDSLYLGDRLRIGQNINGGGARVVQVRL